MGGSGKLHVRLREGSGDPDLYRHCPSMTLDEFIWTIDDPSVARPEGQGEEVTITALAVGMTTIRVRYSNYVEPVRGIVEWPVRLRVVEATG